MTAVIAVKNAASKQETVSITKKAKTIKSPASKAKKSKFEHPTTSEMVLTAIRELNEKKGSSLQAIKKFIIANFEVDENRFAPLIRKYLTKAAEIGTLARTKGHGASGSFRLVVEASKSRSTSSEKRDVKKALSDTVKSTINKSAPKKTVAVQKSVATPKKAKQVAASPARKTKKAAKATVSSKAVVKSKKSGGSPAATPKAPKPKTIKAKKSTLTKKK